MRNSIQEYTGENIVVRFDAGKCIHARTYAAAEQRKTSHFVMAAIARRISSLPASQPP